MDLRQALFEKNGQPTASPRQGDRSSVTPLSFVTGRLWLALLGSLVAIYLLVNMRLPGVLPGGWNIYLAQPLVWIWLAVLAFYCWRFGLRRRPYPSKTVTLLSIIIGLFQVALYVISGLLFGFGNSPYSHTPLAILGNLLYIGSMVVAVELSRAYLVMVFNRGSRLLAVLTPALIFACFSIPLGKYVSVADPGSLFRFYGETLLPSLSENLLASLLAMLAGPAASIGYVGVLRAFEWLSPVLPQAQWTVSAFVGTLAPAFGLIVVRNEIFPAAASKTEASASTTDTSTSWVLVAVVAASLVWFNTGLFGVRPTLISGYSMNPTLTAGDIVITRDVSATEVQVGDIVRFSHGAEFIVHRVVQIEISDGQVFFVTQGDANNVADPPVIGEQIKGKVVVVIPKIGWLSIGVRRLIEGVL